MIDRSTPLDQYRRKTLPDRSEALTKPGATLPAERTDPAYYDVPMLKAPVWKWEIAGYFFLGGVSAGAFLLARMAERFGGKQGRIAASAATKVAFVSFLPCAPLLIADLGDRKRFHHMLRVFKPGSPMSFGAWVLTGYGGVVTLAVLKELLQGEGPGNACGSAVDALSDAAGVPLAVALAGYTGVLLSTTATPMWARNPWLGPTFSAGAISTGAAAVRLALPPRRSAQAAGTSVHEELMEGPIEKIETAARIAEAVTLAGYLATAGKLAEPITAGHYAPHLWGGAVGAGLVGPAIARAVAKRTRRGAPWLRIAGAALALAGGLALRWAFVYAGHDSANDPQADRDASRT